MALKPARLQESDDGALRSLDYGDIYFQTGRALEESHYVFLEKNGLPARFGTATRFHIAELGFGTGLNFLLTARLWRDAAPEGAHLHFVSIEKHPLQWQDLEKIYGQWPDLAFIADDVLRRYPPLIEGFHHLRLMEGRVTLSLLFGDVAEILPQMTGHFDAWYLDGFAPAKNPAMWDDSLYAQIAARTKPGGTLATFSAAGAVRRELEAAGFSVEKTKGYGVKRDMTVASLPPSAVIPATAGISNPRDSRCRGNDRKPGIAIIGAGIAGCSAAHALARRGYRVTVYDRHESFAQEASGNPVAILYPKVTVDASPMGQYHSHAFCYARGLIESLRLPSWNPCGVLRLDLDVEDAQRSQELMRRQDYPPDFTTHLDSTVFGPSALLHAGAGHVDPREFCRALLAHPGIETVYGANIEKPGDVGADIVVIAQANESRNFAETAWLPLQPLRGQISYLSADDFSRGLSKVVCHKGYIAPAIDGMHVIGATFQKEPPAKPELREADHAENIAALNRHLPGFHFSLGAVTGGRASYRATTPDKLPLIGPCPDHAAFTAQDEAYIDNLYICTGFGAHGMTGAPLAGEIIATMIAGELLPVPLPLMDYLRPERFIRRDLRRGRI